jgi:peptidyl-prolyl cis-trans isomerase D
MSETRKKTFRETLLGWGAKILLALLILSFGVWGIGDYVAPQQENETVATVGKSKITSAEFQNEVQFQVNRLQTVLGSDFTTERAKSMGITENVLNTLIQRNIFSEGAKKMGLIISDELVAREIQSDERFKSQSGKFDRLQFDETIQRAGLSESNYISLYKRELLQNQFLSSIVRGQSVPKKLIESIYKFRNEKRSLHFIKIKHSAIVKIPMVRDEVLKKFHKDNAQQFTAPEYRSLTLVQIQIKDIINEIDVSDTEIQEVYDDKINEFKTPETRKIQQILVSEKKQSDKIYEKIKAGGLFAKVAKELANLDAQSIELGTLSRSQIPIKELASVAFNLKENSASPPVKSPLGWHILRVAKIKPAKQKALFEVKAKLKKMIAEEKGVDALYNLSNKFEDELGSGLSIEEAAKRLNFNIRKIPAISVEGLDPANKNIANISREIIQVAFNTEQDQDSALTDFGGTGYFILRVNGIIAPELRPFLKIRSEVEAAWKKNEQAIAAEPKIKSLIKKLKGSRTLANLAKELNANVQKSSNFLRTGAGLETQLPGGLISATFKAKRSDFVSTASDQYSFIGQIKSITMADPALNKEGFANSKQKLLENITNDLSIQYANSLRKKLGVSINTAAVNAAF